LFPGSVADPEHPLLIGHALPPRRVAGELVVDDDVRPSSDRDVHVGEQRTHRSERVGHPSFRERLRVGAGEAREAFDETGA
jgi:hypothetical protein